MKAIKILIAVLLFLFIVMQFFPRNLPERLPAGESDLILSGAAPDDVAGIIKNSCYDCHSFETNYPWYSYVVPSAWLVAKDIRGGRQELNFSEWGEYSVRNMTGKLEMIQEEVSSGGMPLPAYIFIHRKARLDNEQVAVIVQWTEDYTEKIRE